MHKIKQIANFADNVLQMVIGINILKHFTLGGCAVKVASVEPLGAPGALDDAMRQLSHYRRDKVVRYRFERGKWLSAGAGLLLDNMLMEHGLRERDMQYSRGEFGKPTFTDYPELHFNLSHSGTMVACALGDKPVGVDVQHIVELRPGLVNYTMSEKEIAKFETLDDEEAKRLYFTQLWALKECYAKATGRGITHEFPSFDIDENGDVIALSKLMPSATFKMYKLPDAVVSVAILD